MKNSQMNAGHSENERSQRFDLDSKQEGSSYDDRNAVSMDLGQEQHPQSYLFTLRVWEEALGEGKVEWRGRVQDIASGETLFFRDWPGLIANLRRLIAKAAARPDSPGQPSHPDENDE